jgi:hypothetical protein
VIDHFDCGTSDLSRGLCAALKSSPFFVASQSDRLFLSAFKRRKAVELSTERRIAWQSEDVLFVPEKGVEIGPDDLNGCPGFICRFARICDTLRGTKGNTVVGTQNVELRSKIDATRHSEDATEVAHLVRALAEAGSDKLGAGLAEELLSRHYVVQLRVRSQAV